MVQPVNQTVTHRLSHDANSAVWHKESLYFRGFERHYTVQLISNKFETIFIIDFYQVCQISHFVFNTNLSERSKHGTE